MAQLFRSLIFVPGNNERFLEKAKQLEADIVCLDLEDSVPHSEKPTARRMIRNALESRQDYNATVYVRTNSPASGMIPDDLRETVRAGLDGIVIPKVDSAVQVQKIARSMPAIERRHAVSRVSFMPSIESAAGVVNAYQIASSSSRVTAIVFGVFDLFNDMHIEYTKDGKGGRYARAKIPIDATAAGVAAIDAIWQDLKDAKGLEADCKAGKSLGYSGKSIIHPDQIPVTHKAFAPSKSEILWADKVRKAYAKSAGTKKGATTVDGKMIDEVHFKQAEAVLEAARRQ